MSYRSGPRSRRLSAWIFGCHFVCTRYMFLTNQDLGSCSSLLHLSLASHKRTSLHLCAGNGLNRATALNRRAFRQDDPLCRARLVRWPRGGACKLVGVGVAGADEGKPVGDKFLCKGIFGRRHGREGCGPVEAVDTGSVGAKQHEMEEIAPGVCPLKHHPILSGVLDKWTAARWVGGVVAVYESGVGCRP